MLLLVACRQITPAPTERDALLHYFWSKADTGSDQELAEGLDNLDLDLSGDTLDSLVEGSVTQLTEDEVAEVGVTLDPAVASGVYIARPLACRLSDIETVIAEPAQDTLYVDAYDSFSRTFSGSREDFLTGEADRLAWDAAYTVTVLGVTYDVETSGHFRRFESGDGESALIARAFLDAPATITGDNNHFEQDYHIELYWTRGDQVLHIYALWKDSRLAGYDDEQDISQRSLIDYLDDWDDQTEAACAG